MMTNSNQNSQTAPGLCSQQLGALDGLSNSSRKFRLVLDLPAPPLAAGLVLELEGCLDAGVLEKRGFCLVRIIMVGRHSGGIQSASLKQDFSSLTSTRHKMVHLKLLQHLIAGPGSETCDPSD